MTRTSERLVGVVCEDPGLLSLASRLSGLWRTVTGESILEIICHTIFYLILNLWRWFWQSALLEILRQEFNTPLLFILTKVTYNCNSLRRHLTKELQRSFEAEKSLMRGPGFWQCNSFPDCQDSKEILERYRSQYSGHLVNFISAILKGKVSV